MMGTVTEPSRLPPSIWAHIEKDVTGQLAVGSYINQIGTNYGTVLMPAPPGLPSPQPRPPPVFLRPRAFPGLLDRKTEVLAATTALLSGDPVEFHGEEGAGKSSLLRAVAHHPATASFRDGVVFLRAGDQPAADVLLAIFDAFYERDASVRPTDAQIRHALNDKEALLLCDDIELTRDEVNLVLDVAPRCSFLLASPDARLWGYGPSMELSGLPADEAMALLERGLGRALGKDERGAAQDLCAALGFRPLRLLQAAALARESGRSFADLARRLQSAKPATVLIDEALPTLSETQRRILAVLSALDGRPVETEHLSAITGVADPSPALAALELRHLVRANSPYRATGTAGASWPGMDLMSVRAVALDHFTTWAETNARAPGRLAPELDILYWLLRWADAVGRWRDVLRLGRAIDTALALSGRWGIWERALGAVHRAALGLGDRASEAWVLHQLGTRALCLGDLASARAGLTEALRLREALGDQIGAAVTRHNLGFLFPPPGGSPTQDLPRQPTPPVTVERTVHRSIPKAWITAVIVALVLIGAGVIVGAGDDNGADDDDRNKVAFVTKTSTPRRATRTPTRPTRSTRTPTAPPTELPPTPTSTEGISDTSGDEDIPPVITDTPATPVDVAVFLEVGAPSFLSDGRINVPASASAAPEGNYELIVQAIDEQQPIGQSNGVDPILLAFEQYGKKIIVRAWVEVAEDANFNNNSAEQIVELPWPADLVLASCDWHEDTLEIEVRNDGQGSAGSFTTRVTTALNASFALPIDSLLPNETKALLFDPMPGDGPFTITVDPDQAVPESDEGEKGVNEWSGYCSDVE